MIVRLGGGDTLVLALLLARGLLARMSADLSRDLDRPW